MYICRGFAVLWLTVRVPGNRPCGTMLDLAQPPPHASLLQELLLALAGHTGDVFVDDAIPAAAAAERLADPHRNTVHLANDINWINNSEGCGMFTCSSWTTMPSCSGSCHCQARCPQALKTHPKGCALRAGSCYVLRIGVNEIVQGDAQ